MLKYCLIAISLIAFSTVARAADTAPKTYDMTTTIFADDGKTPIKDAAE